MAENAEPLVDSAAISTIQKQMTISFICSTMTALLETSKTIDQPSGQAPNNAYRLSGLNTNSDEALGMGLILSAILTSDSLRGLAPGLISPFSSSSSYTSSSAAASWSAPSSLSPFIRSSAKASHWHITVTKAQINNCNHDNTTNFACRHHQLHLHLFLQLSLDRAWFSQTNVFAAIA